MRSQLILLLTVLAISSSLFVFRQIQTEKSVPQEIIEKYVRWRKEHGKLYGSPAESQFRLNVFYDQSAYIDDSNRNYEMKARSEGVSLSGPMFEMNKFGDLTVEEFKVRYTGGARRVDEDIKEVPKINWLTQQPDKRKAEQTQLGENNLKQSYVIDIKNQGSCGSCWAFSAVATLEKFYYDKTGQRVHLSQQELLDCERSSFGCTGGYSELSFNYASTQGLSTSTTYPYYGYQSFCDYDSRKSINLGSKGSGFYYFHHPTANYLSTKGVHLSLYLYSSGMFKYLSNSPDVVDVKLTGECGFRVDHLVNMYESKDDTITIFNSWGTDWGNRGFKKLKVCDESNIWAVDSRMAHCYGEEVYIDN